MISSPVPATVFSRIRRACPSIVALCILVLVAAPLQADNLNLPDLGDSVSGVVSTQQEHDIGQAFLRLYRSQVPEFDDPLVEDYLENLLARIAQYSLLEDKHLDLIVVNNRQINAFAAPGGVIGVHSGLFLYTQSESELAGVLAHEIAHLSQHHFARGVEKSRQAMLPTLAGMLAGMVLLATTHSDAGIAAITSTQAANIQSSMRFSRENEQEADNIGMQTLIAADFDPTAMTSMFEHLLDATRYMGQRVPEFLLDHPVTEQRISESRARTTSLPPRHVEDSLTFQLMRARVRVYYEDSPQNAVKRFQSEIDGKSLNLTASRYGLAMALIAAQKFPEADAQLRKLAAEFPAQPEFPLALAGLSLTRNNSAEAMALVKKILQARPDYYPARLLQAKIQQHDHQFADAEQTLYRLSQDRPSDARVWYELAEARGQAGNIAGVHLARAEYYILNGVFDKARQQLSFAQPLLKNNYIQSERIKQRLLDIDALEKISLKI